MFEHIFEFFLARAYTKISNLHTFDDNSIFILIPGERIGWEEERSSRDANSFMPRSNAFITPEIREKPWPSEATRSCGTANPRENERRKAVGIKP